MAVRFEDLWSTNHSRNDFAEFRIQIVRPYQKDDTTVTVTIDNQEPLEEAYNELFDYYIKKASSHQKRAYVVESHDEREFTNKDNNGLFQIFRAGCKACGKFSLAHEVKFRYKKDVISEEVFYICSHCESVFYKNRNSPSKNQVIAISYDRESWTRNYQNYRYNPKKKTVRVQNKDFYERIVSNKKTQYFKIITRKIINRHVYNLKTAQVYEFPIWNITGSAREKEIISQFKNTTSRVGSHYAKKHFIETSSKHFSAYCELQDLARKRDYDKAGEYLVSTFLPLAENLTENELSSIIINLFFAPNSKIETPFDHFKQYFYFLPDTLYAKVRSFYRDFNYTEKQLKEKITALLDPNLQKFATDFAKLNLFLNVQDAFKQEPQIYDLINFYVDKDKKKGAYSHYIITPLRLGQILQIWKKVYLLDDAMLKSYFQELLFASLKSKDERYEISFRLSVLLDIDFDSRTGMKSRLNRQNGGFSQKNRPYNSHSLEKWKIKTEDLSDDTKLMYSYMNLESALRIKYFTIKPIPKTSLESI